MKISDPVKVVKHICYMDSTQEKYIFQRFNELYKDFPKGIVTQSDKPDYLIALPGKTIGVEITQVFIDNDIETALNEKRKESLRNQLGKVLCTKLNSIVPFKFLLTVDFGKRDFASHQISEIVRTCESYIKEFQFPLDNVISIDIQNYGQLPGEIQNLNFFHYPKLQESFYVESAGGAVPTLTTKHLQIILDKKDKALNNYQPCNEYWLLVEEGTFKSDSFDVVKVENLQTAFSKVFLYRHAHGELVQVK